MSLNKRKKKQKSKLPTMNFKFEENDIEVKKEKIYEPKIFLTNISQKKIHFFSHKYFSVIFASKDTIRLFSLEKGLLEVDVKMLRKDLGKAEKIFFDDKRGNNFYVKFVEETTQIVSVVKSGIIRDWENDSWKLKKLVIFDFQLKTKLLKIENNSYGNEQFMTLNQNYVEIHDENFQKKFSIQLQEENKTMKHCLVCENLLLSTTGSAKAEYKLTHFNRRTTKILKSQNIPLDLKGTPKSLSKDQESNLILKLEPKEWILIKNIISKSTPDLIKKPQFRLQNIKRLKARHKETEELQNFYIIFGTMNLIYMLEAEDKMKIHSVFPIKGLSPASLSSMNHFYQVKTNEDFEHNLGLFISDYQMMVYDFRKRKIRGIRVFSEPTENCNKNRIIDYNELTDIMIRQKNEKLIVSYVEPETKKMTHLLSLDVYANNNDDTIDQDFKRNLIFFNLNQLPEGDIKNYPLFRPFPELNEEEKDSGIHMEVSSSLTEFFQNLFKYKFVKNEVDDEEIKKKECENGEIEKENIPKMPNCLIIRHPETHQLNFIHLPLTYTPHIETLKLLKPNIVEPEEADKQIKSIQISNHLFRDRRIPKESDFFITKFYKGDKVLIYSLFKKKIIFMNSRFSQILDSKRLALECENKHGFDVIFDKYGGSNNGGRLIFIPKFLNETEGEIWEFDGKIYQIWKYRDFSMKEKSSKKFSKNEENEIILDQKLRRYIKLFRGKIYVSQGVTKGVYIYDLEMDLKLVIKQEFSPEFISTVNTDTRTKKLDKLIKHKNNIFFVSKSILISIVNKRHIYLLNIKNSKLSYIGNIDGEGYGINDWRKEQEEDMKEDMIFDLVPGLVKGVMFQGYQERRVTESSQKEEIVLSEFIYWFNFKDKNLRKHKF